MDYSADFWPPRSSVTESPLPSGARKNGQTAAFWWRLRRRPRPWQDQISPTVPGRASRHTSCVSGPMDADPAPRDCRQPPGRKRDRFLSRIRRSMGVPRAAGCMTMATDEQIRKRLALAYRLLALEIEHRDRVRSEQLDDSDAERAVRLRQAYIERMQGVLLRHHPVIELRAG